MHRAQWMRRLPWSIVLVTVGLIALGWLGIARSEQLAGSQRGYLARQMLWSLLCVVAMLLATVPSYRILIRWSYVALAASIVLLVAVYWFPPVNGAQRWIRVGSVGMQPSEFAKLAFVLAMSRWLMYRDTYRHFAGLAAPLALVMVPLLLVLKEPDLGTALVFLPVLFAMLFAAGARRRHLAMLVVIAVAVLPLLWREMSREQKSRITALASQTRAGERPSDDGYQLHQAKQMLALGGIGGSLLAGEVTDDRGVYTVPEAHTDSVGVVLGERYGLIGWMILMGLYTLLIARMFAVANATREPYGRMVAIGIASLVGTQMLINLGMLVGLLPITGLTLPLVSYGGSSLLANCLALGLVLNVGLRPGYEVTNEPFRYAS